MAVLIDFLFESRNVMLNIYKARKIEYDVESDRIEARRVHYRWPVIDELE